MGDDIVGLAHGSHGPVPVSDPKRGKRMEVEAVADGTGLAGYSFDLASEYGGHPGLRRGDRSTERHSAVI